MTIFDGYTYAAEKEASLTARVASLSAQHKKIVIAAILFVEDVGSQLYTRLKREAAERVGIGYEVYECSLKDSVDKILQRIELLNSYVGVTGIIIQKPRRSTWLSATGQSFTSPAAEQSAYQAWWRGLTTQIAAKKDVDGLSPQTLEAIQQNTWQEAGMVLPATCKAVLEILHEAGVLPVGEHEPRVLVIGRSDILGLPLTYELRNRGCIVENVGTLELKALLESKRGLQDFSVVVSATGVRNLLHSPEVLKPGVVLVDVGEPFPDMDVTALSASASFCTPVPGGVGPVTVVSLLENAVILQK